MEKLPQINVSFQGITLCVCVRTEVLHRMNTSLTTHKVVLADGEHAPALQRLRVGTAGVDAGQETLLRHPHWEPLELAVAQQTGGVETPGNGPDTEDISHSAHTFSY